MRRAAVVVLALAGVAAACQVVGGIERVAKVAPEASVPETAPPPPPSAPPDPCLHTRPPPIPDKDDDSTASDQLPGFFVATRTSDLVPKDDAGALRGSDLDGLCTCDKREFADSGPGCVSPTLTCDGPEGVDNGTATSFQTYAVAGLDINNLATINYKIADGQSTLLLWIAGYNGLANDREVTVGAIPSQGLYEEPPPCAGADASVMDPDHAVWSPLFCGKDKWTLVSELALPAAGGPVPTQSGVGWVNDHILVVHIGQDVPLPFGNGTLAIHEATVSARIVPLGDDLKPRDPTKRPTDTQRGLFALTDGLVTGRVGATELISVFGTFNRPGSGGGPGNHLCSSASYMGIVHQQLCGSLDIPHSSVVVDPSAPCDAVSFGMAFEAFPSSYGELRPRVFDPNDCAPLGDGGAPPDAAPGVTYSCP